MSEEPFLSRDLLAKHFGNDFRMIAEFEAQAEAVKGNTASVEATEALRDATVLVLSANGEFANEYVLALGPGLISDIEPGVFTISFNVQSYNDRLASLAEISYAGNAGKVIAVNAGATGFELVAAGGSGGGSGTAFPGSPATNDRFYRTDRRIEYFYDGVRWLSTTLHALPLANQESLNPITATSQNTRAAHPFWDIWDIYIEKYIVIMNNSATTAANYFTAQLSTRDGASSANLGSGLSGQNDTQNAAVGHSENINSVVASTIEFLVSGHTETGAASVFIAASITYRLVG